MLPEEVVAALRGAGQGAGEQAWISHRNREGSTVRGRRSIAGFGAGALGGLLLSSCAGTMAERPAPSSVPAAVEAVPSQEASVCRTLRAEVCLPEVSLGPSADATALCGAASGAAIGDLIACLADGRISCDMAGRQAVAALQRCGEERLVQRVGDGGEPALREARRFMESWVESAQPWLAVGPLGLAPSALLARVLAADALAWGDREAAATWLASLATSERGDVQFAACRWAVEAEDLTSPPGELVDVAAAQRAASAWPGCSSR